MRQYLLLALVLIFISLKAMAEPYCLMQLQQLNFQMDVVAENIASLEKPHYLAKTTTCDDNRCSVEFADSKLDPTLQISKMIELQRKYESIALNCR